MSLCITQYAHSHSLTFPESHIIFDTQGKFNGIKREAEDGNEECGWAIPTLEKSCSREGKSRQTRRDDGKEEVVEGTPQ